MNVTHAVAYDRGADGPDDHSIDLVSEHPLELDSEDDWGHTEPVDGDGTEAADRALERLHLRRTSDWTRAEDLGGVPGWWASVIPNGNHGRAQ